MTQSLFQRLGLLAATALTAVTLVACGGDSSAPAATKVVALSDLNLAINPANKAAAAKLLTSATNGFTFPSGITRGDGGVAIPGPVKITITGPDADNLTYTMVDGATPPNTTTGTFTIGSCIFSATPTNYTYNNCSLPIALKNQTITTDKDLVTTFNWFVGNGQTSSDRNITVQVDASGNVIYEGRLVGKVDVTAATGATGSN